MNHAIADRIEVFNQGRDPDLLHLKYQKMADNAFAFLRGGCHLFYQDWHQAPSELNQAPKTWVCGDLHLENYGSYRGDNGLTYFDINDFDESVLAPCTVDLVRLVTSLYTWAKVPKSPFTTEQAQVLAVDYLQAYTAALKTGKAFWVERDTAQGLVKDLLYKQRLQKRKAFVKERTFKEKGDRKILIRPEKTKPTSDDQRTLVAQALARYAEQSLSLEFFGRLGIEENPHFFDILDVAERIAGISSLGLQRYMVLIQGEGRGGHYLLDLKVEREACLTRYVSIPQPYWSSQSERIVVAQNYLQAITPTFLDTIRVGDRRFVLREYQPTEAKVNLESTGNRDLQLLMKTLGAVTAWAHLRASGRHGAAIADELIGFTAQSEAWQRQVLEYAQSYSATVYTNWQEFQAVIDQRTADLENANP